MDVRIAGIHMAVFRQAGRIAYDQVVANAHGIVGLSALSPSAAETVAGTGTT